jgi:hypothetical protein
MHWSLRRTDIKKYKCGKCRKIDHSINISKSKKGVPNPKLAEVLKVRMCGVNNPFYGKHYKEESLIKMSDANKNNTHRRGKKQPSTTGENNPSKRPDVRLKISQRVKETHWDSSLEKNPNWNGGSSFLPYKPYKHKLSLISELDGGCCILCSSMDDLTLHHIDFDKLNNSDDNLCLLCRKHNSSVNYKREFYHTVLANYVNMIRNKVGVIYNADLLNIRN